MAQVCWHVLWFSEYNFGGAEISKPDIARSDNAVPDQKLNKKGFFHSKLRQ